MAKSRSRSPKRSAKKSPKRSRSCSPSSKQLQGRCLVCRKTVNISGGKMTKTSKGQPMVKGKCPKCGTTVARFVKRQ